VSRREARGREFLWDSAVRGYELDSFGHVNHAVYLNYFEEARLDALSEGGIPPSALGVGGWGVHVVRVEVNYRQELRAGHRFQVRTRVVEVGRSSLVLAQELFRSDLPEEAAATGRIVLVWIGEDRRPTRVPKAVFEGLGVQGPAAAG